MKFPGSRENPRLLEFSILFTRFKNTLKTAHTNQYRVLDIELILLYTLRTPTKSCNMISPY